MNDRWRVSWKRVGIGLLISFGLLWLVSLVFYYFAPWYLAKSISRDDPHLKVVPVQVPDKTVAKVTGARVDMFEFSFQVPWTDPDTKRDSKSVRLMRFKNGISLMVFNPSTAVNGANIVKGTSEHDRRIMLGIMGSRALSSNCDFMAAELAATPDQVKWWNSRTENTKNMILLTLKSMEMHDFGEIYSLGFGEMRGFQFGNPAVPPYKVWLNLYDVNNRRYQIWMVGKDPHGPVLSQPEVNAIVASLHPIPHS